jgi:hypothetical protein
MGMIGLPLGGLSGIMFKVANVERIFPFGSGLFGLGISMIIVQIATS